MIAVEALWALVALEWSVILGIWLGLGVPIHLLHVGCVATAERWHHLTWHSSHKRKLSIWVANV